MALKISKTQIWNGVGTFYETIFFPSVPFLNSILSNVHYVPFTQLSVLRIQIQYMLNFRWS